MSNGNASNVRTIGAVLLCVVAAGALVYSLSRGSGGNGAAGGKYFYDLQSGELFTSDSTDPAPIAAPSGGQGALATVVACGSCSDPAARQVIYLQKWSDDALRHYGKDAAEVPANIRMEPQVALPSDTATWHYLSSPKGQELTTGAAATFAKTCAGDIVTCSP